MMILLLAASTSGYEEENPDEYSDILKYQLSQATLILITTSRKTKAHQGQYDVDTKILLYIHVH